MKRQFGPLQARPPRPGDDDFIAALYLASRPDLGALPVPAGVIAGIARHQQDLQARDYARRYPDAEVWVVEEEGAPVARVVLASDSGVLRVVDLAVAATARRRGIASTILRALQDAHALALRVRADNGAARALYAQLGFTMLRDDGATLELLWLASGQNE